MATSEASYIDYDTFLDPDFSASSFANTLVTNTNNINDTQVDLSTPLSRVLFDVQEIDTHIHNLTTKSALPLLEHTKDRSQSSQRILTQVEEQVSSLADGYQRLEKEVLRKWTSAEEARIAAQNSLQTLRLARAVARCITLGRQLEGQIAEVTGRSTTGQKDDHRAMVRAAGTILMLRQMFSAIGEGEEGQGLDRVKVIRTLRSDLVIPAENTTKARAQQVINRFSISSLMVDGTRASNGSQSPPPAAGVPSTYAQTEEAKSRLFSAITTLYLLSPTPKTGVSAEDFQPELLLSTLQGYIHNSLTSSLSSLARGLASLPTLDRALLEVSGRCQDIGALETLLASLKRPSHPLLLPSTNQAADKNNSNLLKPLLSVLDTSSLPSYYWRSLASALPARVQEIMSRGGAAARSLKSSRDRLRSDLRECVLRGSQLPSNVAKGRVINPASGNGAVVEGNWEREAAVMVSSVMGALGR
ncbi:Golgi transport complex component Cog5, putative [Talaromyces stipitatus ATCC 10500]|uniref:Conserved oligomeric Golgi complex subunit 5 n=1 Tax=Talaromyces stipitatus (strain ATCC 10500 / CBS 375.48 / QM 6759 / NRRL 1006) TaxID=441959 RepID=B8LUT1_TALSN|nr:Golgi transport complex component Cog5, putative [Talaromyces stipitatus ATCC 10500]EED23938.1 Golgi transport complex component Cog5, putative [Talaromyces stipitatus ATCC 10500]